MRKFKNIYESLLHHRPAYGVSKLEIDATSFGVSQEAADMLSRINIVSGLEPSESIPSARALITEIMNMKDPTEKKWLIWHLNSSLPNSPLRSNYVRNYLESVNEASFSDVKDWVGSLDVKSKYNKFEQALDLISSIISLIRGVKGIVHVSTSIKNNYRELFGIEEEAQAMHDELTSMGYKSASRMGRRNRPMPESVDYKQIFTVARVVFSVILLVFQLTKIIKGTIELRKIFGTRISRMHNHADSLRHELEADNGDIIDVSDYNVT